MIPGVGLVVGATLAFTRYRHERAVLRWSFLAVGAAMFAFQLVSLAVGFSSHGVSAPTQVS